MRTLLTCLVLVTAAAAQDGARARLRGLVRDAADKPWADAKVVLLAPALPGLEWYGEPDRIETTSDARGRFEARVLKSRRYVAWAMSEVKGGEYRVTQALEGVGTGRPIRLREVRDSLARVTVAVEPGPWKERGPLRFKVTNRSATEFNPYMWYGRGNNSATYVLDCPADEKGNARIPAVPWPSVGLEVYDSAGIQLYTQGIKLSKRARLDAIDAPAAAGAVMRIGGMPAYRPEKVVSVTESQLTLPKATPRKLQVRVKGRKGDPLAGAPVFQRVRGKSTLLTKADAEGFVTIELPNLNAASPFTLVDSPGLFIVAEGFAETVAQDSSNAGSPFFVLAGGGKKKGKSIAVLKREQIVRGRLLLDDETPLAGAPIFLRSAVSNRRGFFPFGGGPAGGPAFTRTDEKGGFEFKNQPEGTYELFTVLGDDADAALGGEAERVVVLARSSDPEIGDRTLESVKRFSLTVRGPDGSPVPRASVILYELANQYPSVMPLLRPVTDRRGRCSFRVADSRKVSMLVHADVGYAIVNLARAGDDGVIEVDIATPNSVSGVVKNREGEPQPGVVVQCQPTNIKLGSDYFVLMTTIGHRLVGVTNERGEFHLWSMQKGGQANLQVYAWDGRSMQNMKTSQVDFENGPVRGLELEHPGIPRKKKRPASRKKK